MRQCFLYLPDNENCLALLWELQISRTFQSPTEPEPPVCLTDAAVYLEDLRTDIGKFIGLRVGRLESGFISVVLYCRS